MFRFKTGNITKMALLTLMVCGYGKSVAQGFYVSKACVVDSQPNAMGADEGCIAGTYFFDTDSNSTQRVWDFGDPSNPATQSERGVQHFYANPGDYLVTLFKITNSGTVIESDSISVGRMPMQPKFNGQNSTDTTVCAGKSLKLDPFPIPLVGSNYSYLWYPGGDTTGTIDVDSSGCYSVEVTNADGCSRTASITVNFCFEPAESGGGNERWFFGEGATLEFQNIIPPPEAIDSLASERDLLEEPDTDSTGISVEPIPGGSNLLDSDVATAMVYGPSGALAFYSDGVNIYDGNDELITDADGIGLTGNNTAAQGLSIVPKTSCNECPHHQYYVFSKDVDTGILSYSIIDLRFNDAMGMITERDIPVALGVSEGLTAIKNGSETGFDIFTHLDEGNGIQRISVDSSGIQVFTEEVGTSQNEADSHLGYITFSDGRNRKIAQGIVVGGMNMVEVSDYDAATGTFSNPILIDLGIPAPPVVYGLAFSPSGDYLYVTISGDPASGETSHLLQVPIYFVDPTLITSNIVTLGSSSTKRFGALQKGPIQPAAPSVRPFIYMVVEGETQVAYIQDPDVEGVAVGYIEVSDGFEVDGVTKLGLPNISFANQNQDGGGASASYIGNCFNSATALTASGICDPMRNEITWKFADGTSLKGENVNYTFPKLGWNKFEMEIEVFNTSPLKSLVDNKIVNALLELTETSCTKEVYIDSIYIKPSPVSLLEDMGYVCTSGRILVRDTLDPMVSGGNSFTYSWTTALGVALNGSATDSIQVVIAPATYILDVENDFECQTSDEIMVVEGCEPIIYIPSALNTQSSVGQNRQLKVIYEHIDNEKLEIFNRWGELVYETQDLELKWDGTVKGKVQSPTLYAYKLSYTSVDFPDRGILTEEGAVWVLR